VRGDVGCPKHMTYGPCGGVGVDGSCEVGPKPCVFLVDPVVPWPGPSPEPGPPGTGFRDRLGVRPLVLATLPDVPLDAGSIASAAAELAGSVDAALLGDSGRARVQFPPAYRAALVQRHGLAAWVGLNCRDRNRVALEAEVAALAHLGVVGVHCVTGDHPVSGHRPDAMAVFDLESHELAALARAHGLLVSVAESPAAPPVAARPARTAQKVRAGAELVMLQQCGAASDVARFVAGLHAVGAPVPVLAGVPVIVDREGAELLASFASAVLPPGFVETVLAAADPFGTGVELAVRCGRELLALDGVAGVVLGGGAGRGAEVAFARAQALIGRELARC
jgi:methylenetetrahydrofolate reductase (NADPH)